MRPFLGHCFFLIRCLFFLIIIDSILGKQEARTQMLSFSETVMLFSIGDVLNKYWAKQETRLKCVYVSSMSMLDNCSPNSGRTKHKTNMCLCLGRLAICFRVWFWILFDHILDEMQHRTQMRICLGT